MHIDFGFESVKKMIYLKSGYGKPRPLFFINRIAAPNKFYKCDL